MWRNFGWAAILATWTILLILNSGLAGERASNNPRVNNEHTSREAHRGAKFQATDSRASDDFTLRHARGNRKSSDRASMRNAAALSLESRSTENRGSRISGHEKRVATLGAMVTLEYKDDGNPFWLTAKRINRESAQLSKIIGAEMSNKGSRRKFVSGLSVSPRDFLRKPRQILQRGRRKTRTIRMSSSDPREQATTMRRDVQDTLDGRSERKQHRAGRIFCRGSGMAAFSRDESAKRPCDGRDSSARKFENSGVSKFATVASEADERDGIRVRNGNREDTRRSLELAGNGANKLIRAKDNDESRTLSSFLDSSTSKETRKYSKTTVASAVAANTPYEGFVSIGRTTLIRGGSEISSENDKVDDGENAVKSYRLPKYERSESYKAAEMYKRDDATYSKAGFHVSAMGGNENIEESLTFRPANPLDNHLAGNRVSFTERSLTREERSALSDTASSRYEYHPFISNIGARIDRSATNPGEPQARRRRHQKENIGASDAVRGLLEAERDPSSISLFTERIDCKSKSGRSISARIPLTPARNSMHVRPCMDHERRRTIDPGAGIRGASRIGLRDICDPSGTANLAGELPFELHGRTRHSRKFVAIDARTMSARRPPRIAELVNERSGDPDGHRRGTSTGRKSISFAATTTSIADSSGETWKINEHARSGAADVAGLRNVSATADRSGDHRDVTGHGEHEVRSRERKVDKSRYKREVREISRSTMSIALNSSETRGIPDARMTTTKAASVASPSVSSARASSLDEPFTSAGESLATVKTLPSSKYRESPREDWRSIPRITTDHERYASAKADSISSGVPPTNAPEMLNASSMEAPAFLIKMLDRSTTITDVDSSDIERGISSTTDAADVYTTSETKLHVSSMVSLGSSSEREMYPSEQSASTVDPLPQRNADDLPRDVLENITAGNVDDLDQSASLDQWPVKHSAVVEGDLVLGGLMMVHEREDTVTCGPVMPQGGIQALEAMLYTLDMLNDREIVPGVKIGAHILDDCDKDTYGLEMAVDFIKGTYDGGCRGCRLLLKPCDIARDSATLADRMRNV